MYWLIKAIDNFDLEQNIKFSTYAVPMIIGEIRRYLRDNNPIVCHGLYAILLIRFCRPGTVWPIVSGVNRKLARLPRNLI